MIRLWFTIAITLLTFSSRSSSALADFMSFPGIVRNTIISPSGQTFSWTSGGVTGTVIVRPSGSVDALTDNTPSAGNGRAFRSSFYTGMVSAGGPVGVFYEFLFSRPIDITVYNAETLVPVERITLSTDGDPWTGGWYSTTTGNLVGLGTGTVSMRSNPPTPPHPYAAISSKGVTRLEFRNEALFAQGVPGRVGNSIEINIDSVPVPEPTSMYLVGTMAALLLRFRRRHQPKCV